MNIKNTAVKRIHADVKELANHPTSRYHATPLEDDIFEWHFTIRGPTDTDFAGGIYHGRIILSPEYPFKPPHIVFLTKNGRFEVGTKICLSISAYHPEHWQPAWGIRTMLEAIISFLPSEGAGAIGALDWSPAERKKIAIESHSYVCPICGPIDNIITVPESIEDKPDENISSQLSQLHVHGITSSQQKVGEVTQTSNTHNTKDVQQTTSDSNCQVKAEETVVSVKAVVEKDVLRATENISEGGVSGAKFVEEVIQNPNIDSPSQDSRLNDNIHQPQPIAMSHSINENINHVREKEVDLMRNSTVPTVVNEEAKENHVVPAPAPADIPAAPRRVMLANVENLANNPAVDPARPPSIPPDAVDSMLTCLIYMVISLMMYLFFSKTIHSSNLGKDL